MKKTNMNCGICFEPVYTIFGLEYVPLISCEATKRVARRHARKSRR
ncbi:MAG TPA: hypothetical protein VMD04_03780 [Candidatus Margulisiibacteriota bacterium]|nr:hypothetical protein [Candidatus Margulisiibacteriota bacterium]